MNLSSIEILIFIALLSLIILVLLLLFKKHPEDLSVRFDSYLKNQFLTFQSDIHKEPNTIREEVTNSNNLISGHTIKTIETIKDMSVTMQRLIQLQEETQKLGQSLKDILQSPKLKGSYGEAVLEEMLERVLPKGIWERQYLIDGREQVDAVVKIKGVVIPVDAKFP